jgi:hypothetical protein
MKRVNELESWKGASNQQIIFNGIEFGVVALNLHS